jgi:hypothetical protein
MALSVSKSGHVSCVDAAAVVVAVAVAVEPSSLPSGARTRLTRANGARKTLPLPPPSDE